MKHFKPGAALAKHVGLDPKMIVETFSKYNDSARTKIDPFGKKVSLLLLCCENQQLIYAPPQFFAEGEFSIND